MTRHTTSGGGSQGIAKGFNVGQNMISNFEVRHAGVSGVPPTSHALL